MSSGGELTHNNSCKFVIKSHKQAKLIALWQLENTFVVMTDGKWYTDINEQEKKTEENKAEEKESFWDQPSEFTPESRMELYKHMEEEKRKREEENNKRLDRSIPERQIRLFNDDGKPLNVNQAKIGFKLVESIDNCSFELEVSCYKHMDTSQVELDVQPWYVRVTIKEKILQLVFSEEVSPDKCTAKRSQTTGHLIVNIPKLKQIIMAKTRKTGASHNKPNEANGDVGKSEKSNVLESCDQKSTFADMLSIVQNESHESKDSLEREKESQKNVPNKSDLQSLSEDFVDDPDVPPLI